MRFLANENIPLKSILAIREAGYDIHAIVEDRPGMKDEAVLDLACTTNRIILTFDRDYGELIYKKKLPTPAGLVYFRFAPASPEQPAELLFKLMQATGVEFTGTFTIVEPGRLRQRPL